MVKNPLARARDTRDVGSIPGSGRSLGGEHGNPIQCSCLKKPWRVTVHWVAKSQSELKQLSTHARVSIG